jgi:predicted RNA-binding Zn ribbon-like protein
VSESGRLALALANTVSAGRDLLTSPVGLARWLEGERGLPSRWTAAEPNLSRLTTIRAAIRDLLDARIVDQAPPRRALDVVNEASAAAPSSSSLTADWGSEDLPISNDAERGIRAAIARSAISLLAGSSGARLRVCAAARCGKYFVAGGRGRRWCSPACGNRSRVARHYERIRAGRPAP